MKVITVVGARPQFIKAAVVSSVLREKHTEILVHTGQHYDYNMSEQFFKELNIPVPDYNLGISGGTHAQMTGKMMIAIEEVLLKEHPDWVLVFGDTNSTVAAALSAVKLHIPICHVEAGTRVHNSRNPEEINRICTDHVSDLLIACTDSGYREMEKEGLSRKGLLIGDPMFDAFIKYSKARKKGEVILKLLNGENVRVPDQYYYMTCHREENAGEDKNLLEIFKAMEQMEQPTVYPVHPRNKTRAKRLTDEYGFKRIILTEPVGYLDSICLVKNSIGVVTDSGGLQREAFFAQKRCVTILDFVCWPETMAGKCNQLAKPEAGDILKKLSEPIQINTRYQPFGDGSSARYIVEAMENLKKG